MDDLSCLLKMSAYIEPFPCYIYILRLESVNIYTPFTIAIWNCTELTDKCDTQFGMSKTSVNLSRVLYQLK